MHLTAVTVCIDYADYLRETLFWNAKHFDRIIVVTSPEDVTTARLCWLANAFQWPPIDLVTTTRHRESAGDVFNKGKAINAGLQLIDLSAEWILHLDADIALPTDFRRRLESIELSPAMLYGARRVFLEGWQEWDGWQRTGIAPERPDVYHAHPDGPLPPGFFQLFHRRSNLPWPPYPEVKPAASGSDVLFCKRYGRARAYIPHLDVYHLAADDSAEGINWRGRKSREFCYVEKPPA